MIMAYSMCPKRMIERKVCKSMYSRKTKSWMKHSDFILLDLLCFQLAFLLAYMTRHGLSNPYVSADYRELAVIYLFSTFLVAIANRTMKNVLKRGYYKEMVETVKHAVFVFLVVTLYIFSAQRGIEYSRIVVYVTTGYYVVIAYVVRLLWKRVILRRKKSKPGPAVYVLTTRERAERVVTRFKTYDMKNCTLQGMCILDEDCTGETFAGVPVTASGKTVIRFLCDKWVDEVYVSLPTDFAYPAKMISTLVEMGMVVHVEMEEVKPGEWKHQTIEEIAGATVRTVSLTMATPAQKIAKRALDILGGLVGCVITGILALIIGPIIYIKSPGPIFFKQTRVGQNGKLFKMYKFRSMYMDAEARKAELMAQNRVKGGLMFKLDYDPRIIGCEKLPDGTIKKGIGNYIRDWSLDEFPQFINVLKGDLSLVGTRPPTVDEWEQYELHHRARLAIKPGITGMWQVSGRSNITDFEQVVELDKKYIREWNMGLDFKILLKTVWVVLGKEGSM